MSTKDNNEDLESGCSTPKQTKPTTTVPDYDALHLTLQELQAELNGFLANHTEKVLSLQAEIPQATSHCSFGTTHSADDATKFTFEHMPNTESPTEERPNPLTNPLFAHTHIDISHALKAHSHHLKDFLRSHIQNIRLLHDTLPHPQVIKRASMTQEVAQPLQHVDIKAYESLTEQFNMLVVISTFTASLIVSFVSLVKTIVDIDHRTLFDVSMLLSFFAMSFHFGIIIVAGRGAALTSQHAAAEGELYELTYFHHYLGICEQLQFFATVLFLIAIVFQTFFIFSSIAFPLTLLMLSIVGGIIVFWSVYWKVSLTLRNAKLVINSARRLHTRSLSYLSRRSS